MYLFTQLNIWQNANAYTMHIYTNAWHGAIFKHAHNNNCIYKEAIHNNTYLCACVSECVSMHVYLYKHTYIYLCTHTHTHTHTHTYIYIYIYMYIYIYIYIYCIYMNIKYNRLFRYMHLNLLIMIDIFLKSFNLSPN